MAFKKELLLFFIGIIGITVGLLLFQKDVTNRTPKKEVQQSQDQKKTSVPTPSFSTNEKVSSGLVVREVVDGDTIVTSTGETIRYLGINTPEKGEPFAREATELNKKLVLGKNVRLEFDLQTKDRYGRTLAYVFVDAVFVNRELVAAGYAVSQTIQPNVKYQDEIVKAQQDARDKCRGMWEDLCGNTDVLGSESSCVKITSVHADAPGDDNKNKNGEWVELTNACSTDVSLRSWWIKDQSASHRYEFKNVLFPPQKTIKLYSGCGNDTNDSLYWCVVGKYAIWNNAGDEAFLYNSEGKLVSEYKY